MLHYLRSCGISQGWKHVNRKRSLCSKMIKLFKKDKRSQLYLTFRFYFNISMKTLVSQKAMLFSQELQRVLDQSIMKTKSDYYGGRRKKVAFVFNYKTAYY